MYTKRNTKPLRETKNLTYLQKVSANKMQQTVEVETAFKVFIHFGQRSPRYCQEGLNFVDSRRRRSVCFVLHECRTKQPMRKNFISRYSLKRMLTFPYLTTALSNKASPNIPKF